MTNHSFQYLNLFRRFSEFGFALLGSFGILVLEPRIIAHRVRKESCRSVGRDFDLERDQVVFDETFLRVDHFVPRQELTETTGVTLDGEHIGDLPGKVILLTAAENLQFGGDLSAPRRGVGLVGANEIESEAFVADGGVAVVVVDGVVGHDHYLPGQVLDERGWRDDPLGQPGEVRDGEAEGRDFRHVAAGGGVVARVRLVLKIWVAALKI